MALPLGSFHGVGMPPAGRNSFGPLRTRKASSAVSGRCNILIVDSPKSAGNRLRAVVESLSQYGEPVHEVSEASSTSEALAAVSSLRFDVVLVDLLAPELGGPEFCRILKRNPHTQLLPVFIVADGN